MTTPHTRRIAVAALVALVTLSLASPVYAQRRRSTRPTRPVRPAPVEDEYEDTYNERDTWDDERSFRPSDEGSFHIEGRIPITVMHLNGGKDFIGLVDSTRGGVRARYFMASLTPTSEHPTGEAAYLDRVPSVGLTVLGIDDKQQVEYASGRSTKMTESGMDASLDLDYRTRASPVHAGIGFDHIEVTVKDTDAKLTGDTVTGSLGYYLSPASSVALTMSQTDVKSDQRRLLTWERLVVGGRTVLPQPGGQTLVVDLTYGSFRGGSTEFSSFGKESDRASELRLHVDVWTTPQFKFGGGIRHLTSATELGLDVEHAPPAGLGYFGGLAYLWFDHFGGSMVTVTGGVMVRF